MFLSSDNTYYIPICIWLMDTHPQNAPMCFVKPTPTMQIKVSMYVDHNGKVYLPYLHDWQPHSSDLLSLIQVMIVTFGDHPPVYSKPKEQINTPYPASSKCPTRMFFVFKQITNPNLSLSLYAATRCWWTRCCGLIFALSKRCWYWRWQLSTVPNWR